MIKKIIVVGAGPAGMMAAIRAGQLGQDTTLLEKNSSPGKKILLSGKGRCNLTNTSDLDSFMQRFSKNGQFLRDAFKKFFNQELMRFFQERGLKLNIERQLRVFPATNRADNILNVLKNELKRRKVKIIYRAVACDIVVRDKVVKGVLLEDKRFIAAEKIILATGGVSYPFTGSSGDGLNLARALGHHIMGLRPGLVPLEARQTFVKLLAGLTLKNIRLRFYDGKKEIISDIGELLFTSFGISGPLVLSLSGQIVDWLSEKRNVYVEIDFKPALSKEQVQARLLREFKINPKKSARNVLKSLLPKKLVDVFLELARVDLHKKISYITQQERWAIVALLKGLRLDIVRPRPIDEAMITRGGVSLKEINPRTMESCLIKGLYFCGEMMDVDADTGGFNLQAAFSTGYLAGESASL